jgi:hypothetical protein
VLANILPDSGAPYEPPHDHRRERDLYVALTAQHKGG